MVNSTVDSRDLLPPDTYTVSQLGAELKSAVNQIFAGVWLVGEVQRLQSSRPGHLYLQLVEKGHGDQVRGALGAVIFRKDRQRIERELRRSGLALLEGQQLRCFAQVDFYPPQGRLQLIVRDVDTVFALGDLEQRRRETLEYLAERDLLDANRQLPLSPVPLRIALLASRGSAGYEDFLATLASSGFAFQVQLFDVSVQGQRSEGELSRALRAVARRHARAQFDVAVLVRGGGSRSDLAAFDARSVAEALARLPLPALTGLGHEIDRSVSDEVAHTALKTPTSVAEFLVQRCEAAAGRVALCSEQIVRRCEIHLERSSRLVEQARVRVRNRVSALHRFRDRLEVLQDSLLSCGNRALLGARVRSQSLGARFAAPARRRVQAEEQRLSRWLADLERATARQLRDAGSVLATRSRLVSQLDPQRILQRGFSITRGPGGVVLRSADEVTAGERVATQLAQGTLLSIVEQSAAASESHPGVRPHDANEGSEPGRREDPPLQRASRPSRSSTSTPRAGEPESPEGPRAEPEQRELPV